MASPLSSARRALDRHRARHAPSGFGFVLADSIHYLDPSAWDGVTRGASVFLGRRYLGVVEAAGPGNISPRYAMVFRGREAVAAVAAQSVRVTPAQVNKPGEPSKSAGRIRKRDRLARLVSKPLQGVEQRILVCGNLMSWGRHGIAIAPGVDAREVYPGVAEALYRLRRADRLSGDTDLIVVKDFTPDEGEHASGLRTFSYRKLETDPNMVLELDPAWRSFDDYLAALNSKYRGEIRKVHKDVAGAGLTLDASPLAPGEASELHGLYSQVHANAKVRLFTLTPEFLPAIAGAFGDEFRCSRLRDAGGRALGFVTSLKDGETSIGYYIGFDRAANERSPIYFRLLQATIADALAMGCRRVSLGRTALEPKARLGARPVPMHVWVRHRIPAMNLIVRAALRGVHHDEAPERGVMKAGAAG